MTILLCWPDLYKPQVRKNVFNIRIINWSILHFLKTFVIHTGILLNACLWPILNEQILLPSQKNKFK
jgi:hypothetical protein